MGIIDDLLAHPGTYIGIDRDTEGRGSGSAAAKIVVSRLPGGAGVTLDYETFNAGNEDRIRGHFERAILGRTHGGGAILVTGHIHSDTVGILREAAPGVFELGDEEYAFPMAIEIAMPEPGKLVHIWSYGAPGDKATPRDHAELRLVT